MIAKDFPSMKGKSFAIMGQASAAPDIGDVTALGLPSPQVHRGRISVKPAGESCRGAFLKKLSTGWPVPCRRGGQPGVEGRFHTKTRRPLVPSGTGVASRLEWGYQDLNLGPLPYQGSALTV
jgi:hypothetical protein